MCEESDLLRMLNWEEVYETKVLSRKVLRTEEIERDDGIGYKEHFDVPVDRRIIQWLDRNALFRVKQDSLSSNYTYLFFGTNRTMCALSPQREDISHSDAFTTREHKYKLKINVKYQPTFGNLPPEITNVLVELGFERKR